MAQLWRYSASKIGRTDVKTERKINESKEKEEREGKVGKRKVEREKEGKGKEKRNRR